MATLDHLEIISPAGEIEFYTLDPQRGLTNIGRDPENDIIINDPGVAPFQAMLNHRQKPYQLLILSHEGRVVAQGRVLPVDVSNRLRHGDHLQFGNYTLVLIEHRRGQVGPGTQPAAAAPRADRSASQPAAKPAGRRSPAPTGPTVSLPATPAYITPPRSRPEPAPAVAGGIPATGLVVTPPETGGYFDALPPDESSEFVSIDLSESEWSIEVDHRALLEVTITNDGSQVATFQVAVVGLEESWVQILPQPHINLRDQETGTVTVAIAPPRSPTSYAGLYYFAIVVCSPTYDLQCSQLGGSLIVQPYYDFGTSDLAPKRQSIGWEKRSGQVNLSVHNQGNSPASFRLDGADEEHGCGFEFWMPGEKVGSARQAEIELQPDEEISIPIVVTPRKRQWISLYRRQYDFTITTTMLPLQKTPSSRSGHLSQSALLGPFHLLLLAFLLAFLIVLIFRPYIRTFNVDGSSRKVITAGQAVTLNWNASPFADLIIAELGPAPLESPRGKVTAVPTANISYELRAENWLSRLHPVFGARPQVVSVILTPVPPEVQLFESDRDSILTGENVTLAWLVRNADTVTLVNQTNNTEFPLPGSSGTTDSGPLNTETTYLLKLDNAYIPTPFNSEPVIIRVSQPTATPIPTPAIVRFFANPGVIVAGESTNLEWEVQGVDRVTVQNIGPDLPSVQTISRTPQETTDYILNAAHGPAAAAPRRITVYVTPAPTPTREPEAPVIEFFTISTDEIVRGDDDNADLGWAVSGEVTDVQISGPNFGSVNNLDIQGTLNVPIDETTLFVLTAFNGDKKSSESVQIKVLEPTPQPIPTPSLAEVTEFVIVSPGEPLVVEDKGARREDSRTYRVQKNTKVTFQWKTEPGAVSVIFEREEGIAKTGTAPLGQEPDREITGDATFSVKALNVDNKEGKARTIEVKVVALPAPNPPYNVTGRLADGKNQISWSWDFESGKSDSVGFKIYRSNVPPGDAFSMVKEIFDKEQREWIDPSTPTCGRVYLVRVVYEDINGVRQELVDSSTTSWFSDPCPPE